MAIKFFDSTGYKKVPVEEFWKKIDAKDDWYLDVYQYCEADIDGKFIWVPTVKKLEELEIEQAIFEMECP